MDRGDSYPNGLLRDQVMFGAKKNQGRERMCNRIQKLLMKHHFHMDLSVSADNCQCRGLKMTILGTWRLLVQRVVCGRRKKVEVVMGHEKKGKKNVSRKETWLM